MMRSEKRRRSSGSAPSGAPKKRPPKRRRRRRAGFFYKLLMMILLLVLWPFGLLMLWRRKLRWGIGTKLLTSVVTLAASIILLGFALTVNTGNADYTAMQDKANSFLDVAADALIDAGDLAVEKSALVAEGAKDLSGSLWAYIRDDLADGILWCADLGAQARTGIEGFIENLNQPAEPEATDLPAETDVAVTPEATLAIIDIDPEVSASADNDAAQPEDDASAITGESIAAGILTREGELSSTEEDPAAEEEPAAASSQQPTAKPTSAPTAGASAAADPTQIITAAPAAVEIQPAELTISLPETSAEATASSPTASATAEAAVSLPTAQAAATGATATAEASATPAARPAVTKKPALPQMKITPTRALKEAGLAQVYLSGNIIHLSDQCAAISGAPAAVTLAECSGSAACEACMAPPAEYADQPCLWMDENDLCHTSDACASFTGAFRLILREDALEQAMAGCKDCKAAEYLFPNTAIDYDAVRK